MRAPNLLSRCVSFLLITFFASTAWAAQQAGVLDDYECNDAIAKSTPDSQFKANRDGTVTDLSTGLVWLQCLYHHTDVSYPSPAAYCNIQHSTSELDRTWQETMEGYYETEYNPYAASWRIPNIKELSTIIETACTQPAINARIFPLQKYGRVWSSTFSFDYDDNDGYPIGHDPMVWYVDFMSADNAALIKSAPIETNSNETGYIMLEIGRAHV